MIAELQHSFYKMPTELKDNLQTVSSDFCANSTAHVVPHLPIREKSVPRTFFWSMVFIATMAGSSIHLYSIINSYLEYSTFETITNEMNKDLIFPHVTICDPRSLSAWNIKDNIEDYLLTLYKTQVFHEYVNEKMSEFSKEFLQSVQHLLGETASLQMVYANLPIGKKNISGVGIDEILVHCGYKDQGCDYDNFTVYAHPVMLNCYTFKHTHNVKDKENTVGGEYGLSLLLRSESYQGYQNSYDTYSSLGNTHSLLVSLHEPGTMPNLDEAVFEIAPGWSTSIGLKQKTFHRIQTPKSSCLEQQWLNTPSGTFKKTFETCIKMCRLEYTLRKCKCISLVNTPPILKDESNYCLNVNLSNLYESVYRSVCHLEEIGGSDSELTKCKESCLWPCDMIKYDTSRFSSVWPNSASIPDFIKTYIECLENYDLPKIYHNILKENYIDDSSNIEDYFGYDDENLTRIDDMTFYNWILDNTNKTKFEDVNAKQFKSGTVIIPTVPDSLKNQSSLQEAQEKWIRQSFYRLNIYWMESSVEVHNQVLKINIADLFSGIGGVLGLWTGISVITMVEFMAFIATVGKIVCQYYSGMFKQNTQVVSVNKQEG